MPTTRPRHAVTETDEIAAILDQAAIEFGGQPRAELLRLILQDWSRRRGTEASRQSARSALIGSLPGSSGIYVRADDWPE